MGDERQQERGHTGRICRRPQELHEARCGVGRDEVGDIPLVVGPAVGAARSAVVRTGSSGLPGAVLFDSRSWMTTTAVRGTIFNPSPVRTDTSS